MFVMLKKELKFLEEIKKGKRESRKQNQNMSFKPSMLSSAGIYFYVATWSGNVIAGQTVNFGAANIPEGKSLITMFLTPRATLHISMSYYNMSIYAYSETFTGEITYDVLMILNNS